MKSLHYGGTLAVHAFSSKRDVVPLVATLAFLALVLLAPLAAASASWTLHGAAFLSGTFQGTAYQPDGTVLLSPVTLSSRAMVLDVGPPGSADSLYVRNPFVLHDTDGSYKLWYSGQDGSRNRMLYATSPDGVHWTKHGVIIDVQASPDYFDSVGGMSVIKIGSTYQGWFHGGFWSGGAFGFWGQIYHAFSTDGANWTITGVVLPPNQSWDVGMVNSPRVLQDSHGVFWMYFTGWNGSNTRLGVATSVNGTWFVPYAHNPILPLGPSGTWDSMNLVGASVVLNGSAWTMWYDGSDSSAERIGLAHSTDGFNWTKDAANPVFVPEPAPSWDDHGVGQPDFLVDTTGPRMYFIGSDGTYIRIGLTTFHSSSNNTRVGAYLAPVFDSGAPGTTWDSLAVQASVPPRTSLSLGVRVGNDSSPGATWSLWRLWLIPNPTNNLQVGVSRYLQVQVLMISGDTNASPALSSITVGYTVHSPTVWSPPALTSVDLALVGAGTAAGAGGGALAAVALRLLRKND